MMIYPRVVADFIIQCPQGATYFGLFLQRWSPELDIVQNSLLNPLTTGTADHRLYCPIPKERARRQIVHKVTVADTRLRP
jgi:hypothetical protein